ncbi:hypothetical protein DY78_GL001448 [Lactiplantibacillus fabifermentans DSM 21115]|nr:hypothetical protein DY78_GL001448 [Lactiplantibacillus fabifermentans DSM 21115]
MMLGAALLVAATCFGARNANAALIASAQVSRVKTSYSARKQAVVIHGHATNVEQIKVMYRGKHVKTVAVKHGKFALTQRFKGYGTFKLVAGTTTLKKITASTYATPVLRQTLAAGTKTGLQLGFVGQKHATVTIRQAGKLVKTYRTGHAKSQTRIPLKTIKRTDAKNLTATQKVRGKKVSRPLKLKGTQIGFKLYIYS